MIIGVPKEIKDNEYRVALAPSGARALREAGHRVLVEAGAGEGSAITDSEYLAAGAEMPDTAAEVYGAAELIVKVKEPLKPEYGYLRPSLTVFTFLHLASNRPLAEALVKSGATAVGYETVEGPGGSTPILAPMSEIAGRLSVQVGAHYLLKQSGGRGVLLGGVPGVARGAVAILGAGSVGVNAARMAVGLGAEVTVLDVRHDRLRDVEDLFTGRAATLYSNAHNIEKAASFADLLIGATHIPGAKTPRLVTRAMVSAMKKGAVIVDVSIDQGGCVETIRPTTHSNPVYSLDGVIHYGVANMPGAVPRTSTFALVNVTLPYLLKLSNGLKAASADEGLKKGVNVHNGRLTNKAVAEALDMEYSPLSV